MKKFLIVIMAVVLTTGMVGSSFAFFTDTATSSPNTFTAGVLANLQIGEGGGVWDSDGWGESVDHTWEMSSAYNGLMVPGESEITNNIYLREVGGNILSHHVQVIFTDAITPFSLDPEDMAQWLEVTQLQYETVNLVSTLKAIPHWDDMNGNAYLDLDDLVRSPYLNAPGGPLDSLAPPHSNMIGITSLHMTVRFSEDAPNEIQGATLELTVTFVLHQVAS